MWSTRPELSMLRCSQQVGEHSATGTCVLFSFLFSLFCVFSVTSFMMLIQHLAGNFPPPPKTSIILFPHVSSTYTYSEEQHQHLVFSPCFSERTALILLDKGWESQENISACAHVHIRRRTEISHAISVYTGTVKQTTHHS